MAINDNNAINTLKMNDNAADGNSSYGNDFENMQFVDVDGSSFIGAGTRNSSSADLSLPAGTNTIKLARLYWGGRVKDSDFDLSQINNQKIKVRKGAFSPYTEVTATQIDKNSFVQNTKILHVTRHMLISHHLFKPTGQGHTLWEMRRYPLVL